MDLTRRPAGKWIVDFGWTMLTDEAALYEEPFRWVKEHVWTRLRVRLRSARDPKDSDRYKVINFIGVAACNSIPRETHRGPARVRPSVPWAP